MALLRLIRAQNSCTTTPKQEEIMQPAMTETILNNFRKLKAQKDIKTQNLFKKFKFPSWFFCWLYWSHAQELEVDRAFWKGAMYSSSIFNFAIIRLFFMCQLKDVNTDLRLIVLKSIDPGSIGKLPI